RAGEVRMAPDPRPGAAFELDSLVARPVLEFDLLQCGGGAVSLDAARDSPGFYDERFGARGRTTHRAGQLNFAFEAGHAALDPKRDVGFGGERLVDRIDGEPHLGAAVAADPAGGEAIRITLAGDDERAFAFDRPHERAQLTGEFELVEYDVAVARGIGESGAAILDS